MLAIVSCAAALAGAAHSQEPEQAPTLSPQASGNPPPARPSLSSQEKKPDLSNLEEIVRRIRTRGGEGPATRYPEGRPKAIQFDRNSFQQPTRHGDADPTFPANTPTRRE